MKVLIELDIPFEAVRDLLTKYGGEVSFNQPVAGETIIDRETIDRAVDKVSSGISIQDLPIEVVNAISAVGNDSDGKWRTQRDFANIKFCYPKDALVKAAEGDFISEQAVAIVYEACSPDDYEPDQLKRMVSNVIKLLKTKEKQGE